MCKWSIALLLSKKYETVEFEKLPTLGAFSGMLQLLCTCDPQLSQGLTVDEESASLRGTIMYIKFIELDNKRL